MRGKSAFFSEGTAGQMKSAPSFAKDDDSPLPKELNRSKIGLGPKPIWGMSARVASMFGLALTSKSRLSFGFAAIFYHLVLVGLYSFSILDFDRTADIIEHPFSYQLPEEYQYNYSSLLNIFIPYFLGIAAHSKYMYYLYAATTTVVAFYVIYRFCKETFRENKRLIGFLCIMSTPIPIVLLDYSGTSSAFLTIFAVLLILCKKDMYKLLFGVLLVLANKEQGILVAFGYILLSYVIDEKKILSRENLLIIVSVFVGLCVCYLYIKISDFRFTRSRIDVVATKGFNFAHIYVSTVPLLTLFSGIGLWIAWYVKYLSANVNRISRIYAVSSYFIASSLIASLTTDYTRVVCMLMIPMFFLVSRKLFLNNSDKSLSSPLGFSLAIMFSLFHYQVFIMPGSLSLILLDTVWVRYPWLFEKLLGTPLSTQLP